MTRKKNRLSESLQHGKGATYILVDGQSEQCYLNRLKHIENISVTIKPDLLSSKSLEAQFDAITEALNHYDHVFWLVDYDKIYEESLQQANKSHQKEKSDQTFLKYKKDFEALVNKADFAGKTAKVLINNPCIEYWYLLHFEKTQRHYAKCAGAESALKKHLPDYDKRQNYQQALYDKLKPYLNTAITHARRIPRDDTDIQARADITDLFDFFHDIFACFHDLKVYQS